jgi:hypothetical protein
MILPPIRVEMRSENTKGCELPHFVPDGHLPTRKGERISPQESPYKAIYFLIRYPYSFSAKK